MYTFFILERPNEPFNIQLDGFNNTFATFSWSSNTSGLYLKSLTYNITIQSTNESSRYFEDIKTTQLTIDGLSPLTKYDFLIQARNRYWTFSDNVMFSFETPGKNISSYCLLKSNFVNWGHFFTFFDNKIA